VNKLPPSGRIGDEVSLHGIVVAGDKDKDGHPDRRETGCGDDPQMVHSHRISPWVLLAFDAMETAVARQPAPALGPNWKERARPDHSIVKRIGAKRLAQFSNWCRGKPPAFSGFFLKKKPPCTTLVTLHKLENCI
jgi:hypothetical protein